MGLLPILQVPSRGPLVPIAMAMTTAAGPNPYLRTKVLTASPVELRLLLFDGAIKFLEQAKEGLQQKDHEKAFNGFTRCQNIIMELLNALQPEHSPDLCKKLAGLYTFMYTRVVTACINHDPEIAEEVLGLLRYERESWVMLMDQLAKGEAEGAEGAEQPPNETSTLRVEG